MKLNNVAMKMPGPALSIKAADVAEDGTFTGYGSVFGNEDSYGEIVAPGAFTASLAEISAKGRPVPVLWQHSPSTPIGVYDELTQDDTGLLVKGRLLKDDVAQARETYALMKSGAVSGLSIGYWVRQSSMDEKTGIVTLLALDLVECSVVTFPANDDARIDAVKMKLAHGDMPTKPELDRLMEESGFTESQRAVIATRGLDSLLQDHPKSRAKRAEGLKNLSATLAGFDLPAL